MTSSARRRRWGRDWAWCPPISSNTLGGEGGGRHHERNLVVLFELSTEVLHGSHVAWQEQ